MIKNYILVSFRNFWKNKISYAVCIFGFALGIASSIIVFLFAQNEMTMDTFHKNSPSILRVIKKTSYRNTEYKYSSYTGAAARMFLMNRFSEIQYATRVLKENGYFGYNNQYHKDSEGLLYVDQDFLKMFTFPLIKGNATTILANPNSVVITETIARSYFGSQNPIGKKIKFNGRYLENTYILTVTGVIAKIPENSHLNFNFITSTETFFQALEKMKKGSRQKYISRWDTPINNYVQLSDPTLMNSFKTNLINNSYHISTQSETIKIKLDVEPLKEVYFSRKIQGKGFISLIIIYFLLVLSFIILLVICVNAMNILLSISTGRAKEIGVRKVLGANRKELIIQYFFESIIFSLVSSVIAVFIAQLFLPGFNYLVQKNLTIQFADNWWFYIFLLLISLFIGFASASYPAFFLSSLKTVEVLKGKRIASSKVLRKVILIVQLIASISLFVCTSHFSKNIDSLKKSILRDNGDIVILDINSNQMNKRLKKLKQDLLKSPGVLNVSGSSIAALKYVNKTSIKSHDLDRNRFKDQLLNFMMVDSDYLSTYGIQLLEGNDFSKELPENRVFLINKSAKEHFGWTAAVGKQIELPSWNIKGTIIGVTEDFYYFNPMSKIRPLIICLNTQKLRFMSVRLSTTESRVSNMSRIQDIWNKIYPTFTFEYSLLKSKIEENLMISFLNKVEFVLSVMTIISYSIAFLGLFGVVKLEIDSRFKEIGIRKVLGASSFQIINIFIKQYLTQAAIACIFAWTLLFFIIRKFGVISPSFTIHSDFNIFLTGGFLVILVGVLIITFCTYRAANQNPVDVLKYE